MGRAKLKMKRIEDATSRQITFSKRRNGILKKAYEISTLCDIDIALLMFSPAGRLTLFSTQKRIEDVLARFVDLSDRERENALAPQCLDQEHFFGILQDKEHVIRSLNQLRVLHETQKMTSRSRLVANSSEIEELWHEIGKLQQQLQVAEEHLRMFEPDPKSMTSMEELESCEKHLEDMLNRVVDRKEHLESKLVPSCHTNNLQETFESPSQESSSSPGSMVANWLLDGGYKGHALNSPRDDISMARLSSQGCSCKLNLENMNDCCANPLTWPHLYDTADIWTSDEPSIPLQKATMKQNN